MLKIKLAPQGKKHHRHYRIVVATSRSKLTGSSLAVLGHFHPLDPHKSRRLIINQPLLQTWLAKGAQPTAKIRRLANL